MSIFFFIFIGEKRKNQAKIFEGKNQKNKEPPPANKRSDRYEQIIPFTYPEPSKTGYPLIPFSA